MPMGLRYSMLFELSVHCLLQRRKEVTLKYFYASDIDPTHGPESAPNPFKSIIDSHIVEHQPIASLDSGGPI